MDNQQNEGVSIMDNQDEAISLWVGMNYVLVYWRGDNMYTSAFTKLEFAEQEIEKLRENPEFSAYELYEAKLIRQEDLHEGNQRKTAASQ
ncbi:hypothetical protein [Neisseria sp. S1]|uniref:hypothetical protein n=1 Tax=Neisseria sp. S1 TaxID=3318354 RepID=UPI003A85A46D